MSDYWVVKRGEHWLIPSGWTKDVGLKSKRLRYPSVAHAWAVAQAESFYGSHAPRVVRVRVKKVRRPIEVGDCVRTPDGVLRIVVAGDRQSLFLGGYSAPVHPEDITLVARAKKRGAK